MNWVRSFNFLNVLEKPLRPVFPTFTPTDLALWAKAIAPALAIKGSHLKRYFVVVVVEVYLTSHHKQAISPPLIHVDDRRNEREGGGGQKYGERKGRNK